MRSIVVILYIICFGCYVLFTRQPDYFEGELIPSTIVKHQNKMVAAYSIGNHNYTAEVTYPFLYKDQQKVKVIYEGIDPSKSKVYSFIGYWITFGELFTSVFIVIALYWISTSITKNPTPEALIEELEMGKKKPKKPKYDL